jgi:hypothetical protein
MNTEPEGCLAESEFCDWGDEGIMRLAADLRSRSADEREYAVNAFYWVRDNVFYAMGSDQPWRASDTLRQRHGNCWSKSNLLVALCRASGIPAKFQVQRISGDSTRDITPRFSPAFGYRVTHTAALLFLGSRWVRADCTRDRCLPRACEFDGRSDTPEHPFLIKEGPAITDIREIYEQEMKKRGRIRKASKHVRLLGLLDWGTMLWNIDTDEVRFSTSGRRALPEEEVERMCRDICDKAREQFGIRHRGSLRVCMFASKRLGRLTGVKSRVVSRTKDRCAFVCDRGFPGKCREAVTSFMNGVMRGINPGTDWVIGEGDGLHGEMVSDGSGSHVLPMLELLGWFL